MTLTPVALERDARTFKHAASLARLGYESVVVEGRRSASLEGPLPFELLTSDSSEQAPRARRLGGVLARPRARIAAAFARWLPVHYLRHYLAENRETEALIPDADLFYLHSYWQFPAVRRRCREGAALIYDSHDSYRDISRSPIPGVPAFLYRVEKQCVRRASACTTVSNGLARRLTQRFGRPFEVVRNCQDPRLAVRSESGLREELGLTPRDFLLVMVANNKPGIAMEPALDAIGQCGNDVYLAFVGSGYEETAELVRERGIGDRVHFVPPVPFNALGSFAASADAAALFYGPLTENYINALPNGLFHAVAAGLPLLYPSLNEIAAVAEAHGLGIDFDPEDAGSISRAIERLRTDTELAATLGENSRRAQAELTWEGEERVIATLARDALAKAEVS